MTVCAAIHSVQVAIKIIKLSDEVQAPVRRMSTTRKVRSGRWEQVPLHLAPLKCQLVSNARHFVLCSAHSRTTLSLFHIVSPLHQARTSLQGTVTFGSSMRVGDIRSTPSSGTGISALSASSIKPVSPKVQEELTYLVREIKLLQSLKHPSLCELREYYLSAPDDSLIPNSRAAAPPADLFHLMPWRIQNCPGASFPD